MSSSVAAQGSARDAFTRALFVLAADVVVAGYDAFDPELGLESVLRVEFLGLTVVLGSWSLFLQSWRGNLVRGAMSSFGLAFGLAFAAVVYSALLIAPPDSWDLGFSVLIVFGVLALFRVRDMATTLRLELRRASVMSLLGGVVSFSAQVTLGEAAMVSETVASAALCTVAYVAVSAWHYHLLLEVPASE